MPLTNSKEKGSVALLFLLLFFLIAIFGFSIYLIVASEYSKSAIKIEETSKKLEENNTLNSLFANYRKDILNDVSYNTMVSKLQDTNCETWSESTCREKSLWEKDYQFHNYEYSRTNLAFLSSEKDNVKNGEFGEFYFMPFRDYTTLTTTTGVGMSQVTDIKQTYLIEDNWVHSHEITYDASNPNNYSNNDFYQPKTTTLPSSLISRGTIYIKVKFPKDVGYLNVTYGDIAGDLVLTKHITKLQSKLKDGSTIYALTTKEVNGKPFRIEQITLSTAEGDITDIPLSVLYARDIEVTINEHDANRPSKKQLKLKTQLRIEMGKDANEISVLDNPNVVQKTR